MSWKVLSVVGEKKQQKPHVMKIPKVRTCQAATTDLRQSCKNDVSMKLHLLGICTHTIRVTHYPNC